MPHSARLLPVAASSGLAMEVEARWAGGATLALRAPSKMHLEEPPPLPSSTALAAAVLSQSAGRRCHALVFDPSVYNQ